jgi:mannose-6-phosphate isomerase-like protein (cupin superfamily)
MTVRRVVASAAGGRSSIVSDELIEAVEPPMIGNEIARIWGFDATPQPGESRPQGLAAGFFPPPGGFRLVRWTLPPHSHRVAVEDEAAALEQMEAVVPGMAAVAVDAAGLHATPTLDCQVVLVGAVELVVDDGESTTLGPGDVVVVDGVAHAWRNHGEDPCVLLGVFCGASKRDQPKRDSP